MFKIIVISKDQEKDIEDMILSLRKQFMNIDILYVLDRCKDNSKNILKKLNINFIENSVGDGFLAGQMRDLGLSHCGDENIFFLDGDRIPFNFSVQLVEEALTRYDICLCSVENDFRSIGEKSIFEDDFTLNPFFNYKLNGVFSCGFVIRKSMIQKIKSIPIQSNRLFHEIFDGSWGCEDLFLGNCIHLLGGSCGLFPKRAYLSGHFNPVNTDSKKQYKMQEKKKKYMINILANYLVETRESKDEISGQEFNNSISMTDKVRKRLDEIIKIKTYSDASQC